MTAAQDESEDRGKSGLSGRQTTFWTFVAIILGLTTWVVKTSFSLYLDTAIDTMALFITAISIAWLIERFYATRRVERRSASLWIAAAASTIALLFFVQIAQPPTHGQGVVLCKFGHLGFGYGNGPVWIKAETAVDGDYLLQVAWGSKKNIQTHYLENDTYFTLDKLDFSPGGNTSARITPAVKLSCGHGKPSSDATIIPLIDWQK